MSYIVDLDMIQDIIAQGNAKIIDVEYCKEFNAYISNSYPWMPVTASKIDWKKVSRPYKRFAWVNCTDEETQTFLESTCIDAFDEFCIVYGARQPGLLVSREFAYKNFPILTIFGWTIRFVVGVTQNKYGLIELNHNCFIEVDFIDWLTASC